MSRSHLKSARGHRGWCHGLTRSTVSLKHACAATSSRQCLHRKATKPIVIVDGSGLLLQLDFMNVVVSPLHQQPQHMSRPRSRPGRHYVSHRHRTCTSTAENRAAGLTSGTRDASLELRDASLAGPSAAGLQRGPEPRAEARHFRS